MAPPSFWPVDQNGCLGSLARLDHCEIADHHEIDRILCADLEAMADRLPKLPSSRELRRISERLVQASSRWSIDAKSHEPLLGEAAGLLISDSILAEDLVDAIWDYWKTPSSGKCGQLSYMLRALFDGRRRAIAIERLTFGCADCHSSESA